MSHFNIERECSLCRDLADLVSPSDCQIGPPHGVDTWMAPCEQYGNTLCSSSVGFFFCLFSHWSLWPPDLSAQWNSPPMKLQNVTVSWIINGWSVLFGWAVSFAELCPKPVESREKPLAPSGSDQSDHAAAVATYKFAAASCFCRNRTPAVALTSFSSVSALIGNVIFEWKLIQIGGFQESSAIFHT